MKRTAALLLAVVSLTVPSVTAAASHVAQPSTAPKLGSLLLSVGQMPTGWSVDSTPSSSLGCLGSELEPKGIEQTASASISFEDNGNVPEIGEKLATFSGSATTAFTKIATTLRACKHASGNDNGHKATATIGQMSFPKYGNQSAAFNVNISIEGVSLGEDVLVVRKGSVIMGVFEGDVGSPNLSQFEKYIKLALAKIKG